MLRQIAIPVTEASQVGQARRAAAAMSESLKFSDTLTGRVAIIATELANNLALYAKNGRLLVAQLPHPTAKGTIELLSIDSGPGFDASRCMADGYSTGGTPGHGLGAVKRLATEFDFFTNSTGSAIVARVGAPKVPALKGIRFGCVTLPAQLETVCGDAWHCVIGPNGTMACIVADGLGHGPGAAEASEAAVAHFSSDPFIPGPSFMASCHQKLNATRGAAVAVAHVDLHAGTLHYTGLGNIAGTLLGRTSRRGLVSHNGTVGAALHKVKTFEYPLVGCNMLVMCSDGLQTRWTLDPYPGLSQRHPSLVAAILHRDHYRSRDDATALVIGWGPEK